MNLIWFLTIGIILSIIPGEFGQFPFGTTSFSVSLTDLFIAITLFFLLIWKVGIEKKITVPKSGHALIFFWIIGFISLALSGNFGGIFYLLRFILYSSLFFAGFFLIKEKTTTIDRLIQYLVIAAVVINLIGILQLLLVPDLEFLSIYGYDPHKHRLASSFLDPNFTGAILNLGLALTTILFFKSKNRIWIATGVFLGIGILLTLSRSAYLMTTVLISIVGIFQYRKLLLIFAIGFLISLLLIPRFSQRIIGAFQVDASASARFESWQNGLLLFKEYPFWGVGFNNVRDAFAASNLFQLNSSDGGNAGSGVDSSVLFVLVTTGIVGFLCFFYWYGGLIILSLKKRNKPEYLIWIGVLTSLLINSQFINSLFFPGVMVYLYLLSGAYVATDDQKTH